MSEILFNKFEITRIIKRDEHSSVYEAKHIHLENQVLLKTLCISNIKDTSLIERFKREAKILAKLDHPNIIKVMDFDLNENEFYISFEYFRSKTLRDFIGDRSTESEKRKILYQLLSGLSYAHSNGVIHRDLKPENILVNNKLEVKIADFGLALGQLDSSVTQKSTIVGTPAYMSPEQILNGEVTHLSDLFSLGVIILELFTGNNPFLTNDISKTINRIINLNKEDIFNSGIENQRDDIIQISYLLLEKNTRKRINSCNEVISRLNMDVDSTLVKSETRDDVATTKKTKIKGFYYVLGIVSIFIAVIWLRESYLVNSNSASGLINKDSLSFNSGETSIVLPETEPDKDIMSEKQVSTEAVNVDQSKKTQQPIYDEQEAYFETNLIINCVPWALVYLNDEKLDATPINKRLRLKKGEHTLKFLHSDFPELTKPLQIRGEETINIKVSLIREFGAFDFKVYPWGEIFVDDVSYGQTPLKKTLFLPEGEYKITIKNPNFMYVEFTTLINKGNRKTIQYNFVNQEKNF